MNTTTGAPQGTNQHNQVWLLTGAGRGLGRAIATAVLEAGGRLVAGVRNADALAPLRARHGKRLEVVPLDVTSAAQAAAAVATACDAFGRLDVLINNAGYGHTAPFEQMGADDFREQIETNFFGVVNLTRAALPVMRAQRAGRILQVSSVGGRSAAPGLSAYQAAKWAVGGFSDVVSGEVGHLGIQVCTLEPGGMRTDWSKEARGVPGAVLPDYQPSVGRVLELLGAYGGHEIGDPERIAAVVLDLARRERLPRRLLLGADALFVCQQAEAERAAEQAEWRDVTLSTHFPDTQLPAGMDVLKRTA